MSCGAATQNPVLAKLARLAVQLFNRNTRELVRMLTDETFGRWRRRREGPGMCPPPVLFPFVTFVDDLHSQWRAEVNISRDF